MREIEIWMQQEEDLVKLEDEEEDDENDVLMP